MGNELDTTSGMIANGSAVQQVKGRYAGAIAVQQPRDIVKIESAVLAEADLLGTDAFYAWGAGKNHIEGPSKHLAMTLARCWGNCAVELGPVQETTDAWIFTASYLDLETGFTLDRQFRQAKGWTVHGKFDEERKEDMRFQIGQSKAVRNLILNSLPQWLITRAMDKAKGGVRETIAARIGKHGIEKVQEQAITKCNTLGVLPDRVLNAFGRHAMTALTLEDLVILAGNIRALETGSDTREAMFPAQADTAESSLKDQAKKAVERLKPKAEAPPEPQAEEQAPMPTDDRDQPPRATPGSGEEPPDDEPLGGGNQAEAPVITLSLLSIADFGDTATVEGKIVSLGYADKASRRPAQLLMDDGSHQMKINSFDKPSWLRAGIIVRCHDVKVGEYKGETHLNQASRHKQFVASKLELIQE